ncbi:MAG: ABC transporter permease [Bacteroidales bacterium]|nr:ABC transporter permease [Bacteroidales bacterium]
MISYRNFAYRNALYHWRSNVPVLLGVAVGAAVLTGAFLIGDSLRGSLRERSLRQLQGVVSVCLGQRLVHEDLAQKLGTGVYPSLILQGSIRAEDAMGVTRHRNRIAVYGVNSAGARHFGLPQDVDWDSERPLAILTSRIADHLGIHSGDGVTLSIGTLSTVPRESLLGHRSADEATTSLRMDVQSVLPSAHAMSDFSLVPNPSPAENVFVPLRFLQQRLERPHRVNALLATEGQAAELTTRLGQNLTLSDWELRVHIAAHLGQYISVESERLVLDPITVQAVTRASKTIQATVEPTLVYLANAIVTGTEAVPNDKPGPVDRMIPYSTIAGLNLTASPPLGSFVPAEVRNLSDEDILLVDWPESPLKGLKAGMPITVLYFQPEMETVQEEKSAQFTFRGYVPLTGSAADPDLTPPFPGVTDKLTISEWDAPFPINHARIRPRDEHYWDKFRATPKAYISSNRARQLFGSRFGDTTSMRIAPPVGTSLQETVDRLIPELLAALAASQTDMHFEPTQERLLQASQGGTDFGMLFLGFSFFLIAAALLLVGLLFRLALERRAKEIGILLGTGYSPRQVLRLLLAESLIVAACGTGLGLLGAVLFARGMLSVTAQLWPSPEAAEILSVHVSPVSFLMGYGLTIIMTGITVWAGIRSLVKVPVPILLHGRTCEDDPSIPRTHRRWFTLAILGCCLIGAGLLGAGGTVTNPDVRAGSFFGGGLLLLVAGLLLVRRWLQADRGSWDHTHGRMALLRLGIRNCCRAPGRTLLTATLLASATFLLVAVESFRRRPDQNFLDRSGGSGGFSLLAEADVPLFQPFSQEPGRGDLVERLQVIYQDAEAREPNGPSRQERLNQAETLLDSLEVLHFRLRGGDDASCLNLYQAGQPRILGVPDALIQRGGFQFSATLAETPEERANPWLLLQTPKIAGTVPIFVEQNSAMWMLKSGLGGLIHQTDDNGMPITLHIVGTLQDSVFQSELLMNSENFRSLYPREEGFRVFLMQAAPDQMAAVTDLLETALAQNGLTVTRAVDRVAQYQAVVGAYLTTFQLLGAFGLLLGVLGMGIVILRSVWERMGELALLRAVGYRTSQLMMILVAENVLVLIIGLTVGLVTALLSVLPNLALGGELPGFRLAVLLLGVFVTGLVVTLAATRSVTRVPLIPALRHD